MLQELGDKLDGVLRKLKGQGKLTEKNIADSMRDIRRALLEADVNYKVAKQFIKDVEQRALGQEVIKSISPGQMVVKIINDELTKLMGEKDVPVNFGNSMPGVIMLCGLQGSGKTTLAGKLANHFRKKGRNPLLAAADIYRPAAIDQLKVVGEQVQVPVYTEEGNMNPVKIAKAAIKEAKLKSFNAVIIDTAGRLAIDEEMMNEIEAIKKSINPSETLFVVDSMTGQDAVNTAKAFNDRLDFDGVVLTKLDGDTRGGAALSIKSVVNKPIKFVGTGEKMDALDVFHPKRMADRILGMGDIVSLVEKAQEQYDADEARKLQKKLAKNTFDFTDFMSQIQQIKKMGNGKDLMGMIPGMGKAIKNLDIDDDACIRSIS